MKQIRKQIFLLILSIGIQFGFIPKIYASNSSDSIQNKIPVIIGKTVLPDKVPYLNKRENYLVGNGIICASGTGNGQWNFIAGPDYTCPNYIRNEKISIIIDGAEKELIFDMYRARETGSFYGTVIIEDLKITLLDYTVPALSIVSRIVLVDNKSTSKKHSVQLKAYITPYIGNGRKDNIVKAANGTSSAVLISVDTTLFCMFGDHSNWVRNSANRYLTTSWSDTQSDVKKVGESYQVISTPKDVPANKTEYFNLCHYAHFKDNAESYYLEALQKRNGISDAEQNIVQWQQWYRNVPGGYKLDNIKDQRARDIVEGGLYIIKTNQTKDGGIVANEATYNLSWTRDAYCGLRAMLACGHFDELKQFVKFMEGVYAAYKFIPNAMSCGSNTFALYNGNFENNPSRNKGQFSPCPEANTAPETPALLVLVARDYYHATKDAKTIIDAEKSIRYSIDIQLKHAINNNYKLEFSGDETELCGAVATDNAGFDRHLSKLWSMSSIALCCASLDFYTEYLALRNEKTLNYKNSIDGKTLDLKLELQKLTDALDNDYWRTDLSEYPDGFYDWCRIKQGNSFPPGRIVNFSLFPIYYKMKSKYPERFKATVVAMKSHFDASVKKLPLVPNVGDGRYLGHDLGYLLWSLIEINDKQKDVVYDALVNGPGVQCWGSYNEAYDADGKPNGNNLRTFETGVNIDAIAKYWNLGNKK